MNEIHLHNYHHITIKLRDGQVSYGLERDPKTQQWFVLVPSAPIGEVAAQRKELTVDLIARIVKQSDGTIFLDLSNG